MGCTTRGAGPWCGTSGGYTNHYCRCARCTEAFRLQQQEYRARIRREPLPNHVHGTMNGYLNYACRCDRCKRASHDYYIARREAA